jgi:hypothetical protein
MTGKKKDKTKSSRASNVGSKTSHSSKAEKIKSAGVTYSDLFPVHITSPDPPPETCCDTVKKQCLDVVMHHELCAHKRKRNQLLITLGRSCIGGLLLTILINFYFGSFPSSSKNKLDTNGMIVSVPLDTLLPPNEAHSKPISRKELVLSNLLQDNFGIMANDSENIRAYSLGLIASASALPLCKHVDSMHATLQNVNNFNEQLMKVLTSLIQPWSQGSSSTTWLQRSPQPLYMLLESKDQMEIYCKERINDNIEIAKKGLKVYLILLKKSSTAHTHPQYTLWHILLSISFLSQNFVLLFLNCPFKKYVSTCQ